MSDRKNLTFITVIYGIAVILVVFGHSHPLHIAYPAFMAQITKFIYIFHMPLFFLVSGILIVYTAEGRNIKQWWIKKVIKLGVPYIVLSALAWFPKTLLSEYMNDNMEFTIKNIVRILFIPRENIWGHFWFIPVYLILSLLCAGIWKCTEKGNLKIVFWVVSFFLNIFPVKIAWFGIEDVTKNLFYMVIGLYISKSTTKDQFRGNKSLNGMVAVIAAGFIAKLCDRTLYIDRIVCLVMLYAVLNIVAGISKYPLKILKYIGKHAFTIYIYSWPIQAIIELFLFIVLKVNWLFCYIIMFAGGLTGPLLIYYIYNRWFSKSKFLYRMIGS